MLFDAHVHFGDWDGKVSVETLSDRMMAEMDGDGIDCFSIKPLPAQLILASIRRTGCCVVAEEHNIIGGLGEAIAGLAAEENPVPMKRVAISDRYGQSGTPQELQKYYGLTFREIVGAAAQAWSMRRR